MAKEDEPQPQLKLAPQEPPHQKISINHMPAKLHDALTKRAKRLSKKLPNYCRVVLEHAMSHREDYHGSLGQDFDDGTAYERAVHIPILNKAFMKDLYEWDPYGLTQRTAIALSILKRHLEVRQW